MFWEMENRFWKIFVNFLIVIGLLACSQSEDSIFIVDIGENDLVFNNLTKTWDEGMPIGNGLIGGLVWQKDNTTPPGWELYDLTKDPLEMNNVYNNPEYADIVADLTKQLGELRVKYLDSEELDQKFIDMYNE